MSCKSHDHRRPKTNRFACMGLSLASQWLTYNFEHGENGSQLPTTCTKSVFTLNANLTGPVDPVHQLPHFPIHEQLWNCSDDSSNDKVSGNSWCVGCRMTLSAWPCDIFIVMYSGASAFNWLTKLLIHNATWLKWKRSNLDLPCVWQGIRPLHQVAWCSKEYHHAPAMHFSSKSSLDENGTAGSLIDGFHWTVYLLGDCWYIVGNQLNDL